MDTRCAHGVLVDQTVDHLGQRFNVQSAAADDVEEERAQLLGLERCGDFENIVNFQAAPQVLGLLDLAHREQAAVQRADACARDDVRRPVQLLQCAPDANLIAAFGPAAGQHQRTFCGMFHQGCLLTVYVVFIIPFFAAGRHSKWRHKLLNLSDFFYFIRCLQRQGKRSKINVNT